jgi:hypothetical protein
MTEADILDRACTSVSINIWPSQAAGNIVIPLQFILDTEYHCSGMPTLFLWYSCLTVFSPHHNFKRKRIQKKKNFDIPLQWYSVTRIIAAALQYFPSFGRVRYSWRRVYFTWMEYKMIAILTKIFLQNQFR